MAMDVFLLKLNVIIFVLTCAEQNNFLEAFDDVLIIKGFSFWKKNIKLKEGKERKAFEIFW